MAKTILLIDDDRDDQVMFKDALRIIDPQIICDIVPNGRVALDMLSSSMTLPHLTFLDLNMPIMDGYEFLREIRKYPRLKGMPVGVLSTSSVIPAMKTSKALGARFYLTKPNDFKMLCDKIGQILSASHAPGEYVIVI
jgi:CheY-like chemotaxis protein